MAIGTYWHAVAGAWAAWFDASSLSQGADVAGRILELAPGSAVEVRGSGIRVRLDDGEHAWAVSAAARELGLIANPDLLADLTLVIETANPVAVSEFWRRVLDYDASGGSELADPLRRDPGIRIRSTEEVRPLRNRLHLDVVRPGEAIDLGEGAGPYGVCHADPDGNEVDLVPGDPLGEGPETADWRVVWGAMACYRTTSPAQQRELAVAAARLADEAGFPLLIDLRPGLVILDTGKDQVDADAHGLDLDVTDLAAGLQAAARELGATADVGLPRLVQLFFDAADIDAVRAFWVAALGYVRDRRDGVSDIVDPRRLNPVLVFQQIDTSETERLVQRGRIHVELAVPEEVAQTRVESCVAAGGRVVEESAGRWLVADPEGNELTIIAGGEAR